MDDNELVRNLQDGDKEAFKRLFDQYQHMVYNVCYRMTGNRQDAEDATQDVFLRIHHSIGQFRSEAKLSSWICRIAVNTCLNREQRRKLIRWVSLDFLVEDEGESPLYLEQAPDRQIEKLQTEHIVQEAIRALPPRQKTALILQRYENLSYQEIALVMETSVSAVESLLCRAKENLAQKLIPLRNDL